MPKEVNCEDFLFENSNNLVKNGDEVSALIVDAELDPLECKFNNDGCIEINTQDYTYLTLTVDNLNRMKLLINEAEKHFQSENN